MILQSKRVWIMGQFMAAQLELENGKIIKVYPYDTKKVDEDYANQRVVPGFIDLHTHGAYGCDVNEADPVLLRRWQQDIPQEGVTALMPTTITQSEAILTNAVATIAKVAAEGNEGAEILGVHLEGPYLSLDYCGAQPAEHIVKPDVEQFKRYQHHAQGWIKLISLAIEEDDDFRLIRYCHEHQIVVSIGHSACSYEQACMAIANGATSMTHTFNAMTPLHHRAIGLAGGALRLHETYGEIIGDGNHVAMGLLNTFFLSKGASHGILITDSLAMKGMPIGSNGKAGGNDIVVFPDGSIRLQDEKTLAGSTLRMNEGLRILVEEAMVPFEAALNACTINPANLLSIDHRKGRLVAGYDADIVVLQDDYSVEMTYVRGKKAF